MLLSIFFFAFKPAYADVLSLDAELKVLLLQHNLSGVPLLKKSRIEIQSPLAQLGKRLFFSTLLGGKNDTACVSCHHPLLGGGDRLPLPIGVDAMDPKIIGPGRKHSPKGFEFDGGPTVPRNSPTTFNTVFYSRCMFWDCRIESLGATPGMNGSDRSVLRTPDTMWGMPNMSADSLLQAQASFPVTAQEEMRAEFLKEEHGDKLRQNLASRILSRSDEWVGDFQKAFHSKALATELITFENITFAIAAYEASQIFVDTPWKKYVEGDISAISVQAKQGAVLFYKNQTQGGYGCVTCHKGDFFTDEQFHVLAIPQIGRGTDDGPYEDHDYGRFVQTGNIEDKFAFRTPPLLNVEVTGPYGHSGAYRDLRSVVRHMLNPGRAIASYDFSLKELDSSIQKAHAKENTEEALKHLRELQAAGKSEVKDYDVKETEIDALHAFLLTLTDPCVKSSDCMSPWLQ